MKMIIRVSQSSSNISNCIVWRENSNTITGQAQPLNIPPRERAPLPKLILPAQYISAWSDNWTKRIIQIQTSQTGGG